MSCLIYDSIIEGAQELCDEERGQLYQAVIEYLYFGREPEFPMAPAPKAIFIVTKPSLDTQRAKSEAGARGGKAKHAAQDTDDEQTPSKAEANAKQTPSKAEANAKQTPSKAEANAKQTPSEEEANAKQTPSEEEANAKQTPSKAEANAKQTPSEEEEEEEKEDEEQQGQKHIVDAADTVRVVIGRLNERTGKAFRADNRKTNALIKARLREGFTVDDLLSVVELKCDEWKGTDFARYLRPETLFGTKFEGYLNQRAGPRRPDFSVYDFDNPKEVAL